jgi:hypothetical protein
MAVVSPLQLTCFSTFLRLKHLELVDNHIHCRDYLPPTRADHVRDGFETVPSLKTVDYEDAEGRRWHFVVTRDEIGSGEVTSIAMTSFGLTKTQVEGPGLVSLHHPAGSSEVKIYVKQSR